MQRYLLLALMLAGVGLQSVSAQTASPAPETAAAPAAPDGPTLKPIFQKGDDPGPYYPERALRLNRKGFAVIDCAATTDGDLHDCSIEQETPSGEAFGLAALMMVRKQWIRVAPGSPEHVRVRIDYQGTKFR